MKTTRFFFTFLLVFGSAALAQEAETIADEDVPPLPQAAYPNELVPLGNGIFLVVREDGLAQVCAVKGPTSTQYGCGGWQYLPK